MRPTVVSALLVLAGIAIGSTLRGARAEGTPAGDAVEYQFLEVAPATTESEMKALNQLGAQGWSIGGAKVRGGFTMGYLLVRHKR